MSSTKVQITPSGTTNCQFDKGPIGVWCWCSVEFIFSAGAPAHATLHAAGLGNR